MKKGLSPAALLGFCVTFIGIAIMLPVINQFVIAVSPYMDPLQTIAAGLIGVVLILAAFVGLFNKGGTGYEQNY